MSSPHAQTICPTCSATIPSPEMRCDECGTFLQDQGNENNPLMTPDSDYEIKARDPEPKKKSSGFSGIFQLADDAKQETEKRSSQNSTSDASTDEANGKPGSSGFSGIFNLADEAKPAEDAKSTTSVGESKQQSSPSREPRPSEQLQPETGQPSRNNPKPATPNAPTSGFSGVFRVADEVRGHAPREDFSSQDSQPEQHSSSPETSPARSNEMMSSVEFDTTPLPQNRAKKEDAESGIIRLQCRKCGRKLRVKNTRAGQKIECPKCENKILVPKKRDLKSRADQNSPQKRGIPENELSFTALAKQLASPAKSDMNAEETASQQSAQKGFLSSRKYRKLTKVLEAKGLLPPEKLSQRADVLREMGQSGDARAYDWLASDLEHNELQIRQAAAVGLGDLGDSRCVPPLVALLDDDSMVLRKAAVLGLGKIKDPRSIKPLLLLGLNDPPMKFLASEAIVTMGEAAVQTLIELLDDHELGIVLESIVLLGRIKDTRARRALMMVVDARQPVLQCHAIEALGQIGDPKSIGPLTRLMSSSDANVRVTATAALSKMASNKNVVAPLVQALDDPDEDVVVQAATGLGETGVKRAAEPLSRLLRSPSEKVRVAVAQAMGALGDQRAVPHLMALLDIDSQELQLKVLTTLRAMKPPHISGELLKRLDHPNAVIRRRVIDVLAPIGDAEVAEQLERVLRMDPADEVRMAAVRALGEIADPASVDAIKEALHNDEFNVRCQAIGALGAIGDEECYNTLMPLLEDQVSEVRFHAASALGEVGDKKAIPALQSLLKDKNSMVVRGATKALEKLGVTDVESQVKRAQRSKRMDAVQGVLETVKSYFPDTAHGQKIVFGGTLAGLLLVLGLGWGIWKVLQGPTTKTIARGRVGTLSFSPGDSKLVVGRTLGLVEIWNSDSGRVVETVTPPGGSKVFATPNPETLAVISGTAVHLWKIGSTEPPPETAGHSKPIIHSVVTTDQKLLATLSGDGVAIVWDLTTGTPRGAVQLSPDVVDGFAVSRDGSLFAAGNKKGLVMVWNAASGEPVTQFKGTSPVMAIDFHPDGKRMAVSDAENVEVYDLESGGTVATLPKSEAISLLKYDPNGKRLLGVRGAHLSLWDADSPAEPTLINANEAEQIQSVAFTLDGGKLAVGSEEKSAVWTYDANSGQPLKVLNVR